MGDEVEMVPRDKRINQQMKVVLTRQSVDPG